MCVYVLSSSCENLFATRSKISSKLIFPRSYMSFSSKESWFLLVENGIFSGMSFLPGILSGEE